MRALVLAIVSAAIVACGCPVKAPDQFAAPVDDPIFTSAELDAKSRRIYYHLDEGIQYLPIDVMLALSRARSKAGGADPSFGLFDERFLAKPERFGLFRLKDHDVPVGITVSNDDFPMAGINCATCHTALVRGPSGRVAVVDGAPSLFAVNRLVTEMAIVTLATALCGSEFDDFYDRYLVLVEERRKRMLARNVTPPPAPQKSAAQTAQEAVDAKQFEEKYKQLEKIEEDRTAKQLPSLAADEAALQQEVASLLAARPRLQRIPTDRPLEKGEMRTFLFERFGFFSGLGGYSPKAPKVGAADLGRANPWGVSKNYLAHAFLGVKPGWQGATGGPISTPYLWDFKSVETVFWAGSTNSLVERDFAQGVALLSPFDRRCESFETTVSIRKLDLVRRYAALVTAPSWPERVLGPIDGALAAKGRGIYDQRCAGCHDRQGPTPSGCAERAPLDSATGQVKPAPAPLKRYLFCDVNTDGAYTASLMEKSPARRHSCSETTQPGNGDLFADFLGPVFGAVKASAYVHEGLNQAVDEKRYEWPRLPAWWLSPTTNAYVAKPLKGVWASAPYLHNGSVPTLRALLDPASKRPTEFFIGPTDYDVKNVGFQATFKDVTFYSRVVTSSPGSSNVGHEFGTDLPDEQKDALLEYVKSL